MAVNPHLEQFSMRDVLRAVNGPSGKDLTAVTVNNYFHRNLIEKKSKPGKRRAYTALEIIQVAALFHLTNLKLPVGEVKEIAEEIASRAENKATVLNFTHKLGELEIIIFAEPSGKLHVRYIYENNFNGAPNSKPDLSQFPAYISINPDWIINYIVNELTDILDESGELDNQDDHGEASREEMIRANKVHYAELNIKRERLEKKIESEKREATFEEMKELAILALEIDTAKMAFSKDEDIE
ncbi:MAG: hypothetical protein JAY90_23320 [Candidatus Thiodiazotropha lotti]|nr:hypothetical protein [Candidatus Thiodiazotropha lotti]